jgi:hypothetical protein
MQESGRTSAVCPSRIRVLSFLTSMFRSSIMDPAGRTAVLDGVEDVCVLAALVFLPGAIPSEQTLGHDVNRNANQKAS